MRLAVVKVALLGIALVSAASPAQAAFVTASERISDPAPFDAGSRDLARVRSSTSGIFAVELSDPTIISDNSVNANFGILNNGDVSYVHRLDWLSPAVASYTAATLDIRYVGAIGNDDVVFADSINLGSLPAAVVNTFSFTSNNGVFLNGILADGVLSVFINKNIGGGLANLNLLSVIESTLTVTYQAVPEPSSVVLVGLGLIAAGLKTAHRSGYLNFFARS